MSMVVDFNDQALLNPRLKNTVGHIFLSFSPKDASRMTDALMTRIAKEYMQRMGITDTQYLLLRHLDQPHPHCHIWSTIGWVMTDHFGQEYQNPKREDLQELTVNTSCILRRGRNRCDVYDCANQTKLETKFIVQLYIAYRFVAVGRIWRAGCKNKASPPVTSIAVQPIVNMVYCSLKNGFEFSSSKIDRQFSDSKLNRYFAQAQQQTLYRNTLIKNLDATISNYRSAFTGLFGNMGGGGNKGQADAGSINFGGNIGALPLPPNDSPIGLSAAQLQRKPGESPEGHIARITALLNTVAEAMAIAAMEQKRRQRERMPQNPKRD